MVDEIHQSLQNVFQKMYLNFLDFILPMITDLNLEMQVEFFIKIPNSKDVLSTDYHNPRHLFPSDQWYFGNFPE